MQCLDNKVAGSAERGNAGYLFGYGYESSWIHLCNVSAQRGHDRLPTGMHASRIVRTNDHIVWILHIVQSQRLQFVRR